MFQNLSFHFRSISKALIVILFLGVFGVAAVRSQEAASSRPALDFEGNKIFSKQELLDVTNKCLDQWIKSPYNSEQLEYCLNKVINHMHAKGYLQARLKKTLHETEGVSKVAVAVTEGALFRVGKSEIKNSKVLNPDQIREMVDLNPGDIANGERLSTALFVRVKEAYGKLGYIQYAAEIIPEFHLKEKDSHSVADFSIIIDEGRQFKIRSIRFTGGDRSATDLLRRELMVREGEVYNAELFSESIIRINNTGLYDLIDIDRDVDYRSEETAILDLTIRLKKKISSP